MYKYNTKDQAKFYIEHMGADFSDYILEDETYQKALANVKQIADKYAKITVVDREFILNMLFGKDDIVIAVGRDGLVCNTVKYLSGQKLIGVNPDPARWDGILLPFEAGELEKIIAQTITGDCDVKNVTMAKAACGLFGYDDSGDYEKIGWDEKKLSFVVREPFPSNTTDATVVYGTIGEGDPFAMQFSETSNKRF